MENTPMGCGSDLPTNLKCGNIETCERFFKCSDVDPNSKKDKIPAKATPGWGLGPFGILVTSGG